MLMAGLGMNSLPSQALSDSPDVRGCYQVGAQNSQGSVPGEWEGQGLGINLVFSFLGCELPRSEPSGRRGPCQSVVTVYHGQPRTPPQTTCRGNGEAEAGATTTALDGAGGFGTRRPPTRLGGMGLLHQPIGST